MEQREDLKRWLDNLVKVKKEELGLRNFSRGVCTCANEWIQLFGCGRYIAETLEIPYAIKDIGEYNQIKFIHNGIEFVCLETKEN